MWRNWKKNLNSCRMHTTCDSYSPPPLSPPCNSPSSHTLKGVSDIFSSNKNSSICVAQISFLLYFFTSFSTSWTNSFKSHDTIFLSLSHLECECISSIFSFRLCSILLTIMIATRLPLADCMFDALHKVRNSNKTWTSVWWHSVETSDFDPAQSSRLNVWKILGYERANERTHGDDLCAL